MKLLLIASVNIDLVDEKGRLATLSEHPADYANNFLKNRRTYILIKVTSKSIKLKKFLNRRNRTNSLTLSEKFH